MDKPTKYLFAGLALAALICIVGYLASLYENSQLTSLVEKCNAEALQAPKGPWLNYRKAPLVCDPADLAGLRVSDVVGVQKEIVVTQLNVGRALNNSLVLAVIVLVLFAAPYAWYFLLRRIRELRDAIAGR